MVFPGYLLWTLKFLAFYCQKDLTSLGYENQFDEYGGEGNFITPHYFVRSLIINLLSCNGYLFLPGL